MILLECYINRVSPFRLQKMPLLANKQAEFALAARNVAAQVVFHLTE